MTPHRSLPRRSRRVAVAMSGGVDSSVAAALLVQRGYSCVGFYLKNFSPESWQGVVAPDCPWEHDVADCRAVCTQLGIPFASLNFEREYRRHVIDYFFREYRAGRTPNPDIRCNREIKFGCFLRYARRHGFASIATGHYAGVDRAGRLFQGRDGRKDQSYFLAGLSRRQLRSVLFPLSQLTKPEVRTIARQLNLPNADKPDSQGVCFVGEVNLREFLQQRLPSQRGPIVNLEGSQLGVHPGAWYYTVGQRSGLGLAGGPYYVVRKDTRANELVVAPDRQHPQLNSRTLSLRHPHWLNRAPRLPFRCAVRIRHQQPPQAATVHRNGGGVRVAFDLPQFAAAPGQTAVIYRGDEVIGAGTISRTPPPYDQR